MAAFIAGAYKTPLTAVVFVAEATGGHAFIVPALIGAAVAYAISGEASVSGEQRLHESVKVEELANVTVGDVMHQKVVTAQADWTLEEFVSRIGTRHAHTAYPVCDNGRLLGLVSLTALSKALSKDWAGSLVADIMEENVRSVSPECDLQEALRLLTSENSHHMLLVASEKGALLGVLTKTDILRAMTREAGTVEMPAAEIPSLY
jgi:CIC family chloride channel protein